MQLKLTNNKTKNGHDLLFHNDDLLLCPKSKSIKKVLDHKQIFFVSYKIHKAHSHTFDCERNALIMNMNKIKICIAERSQTKQ